MAAMNILVLVFFGVVVVVVRTDGKRHTYTRRREEKKNTRKQQLKQIHDFCRTLSFWLFCLSLGGSVIDGDVLTCWFERVTRALKPLNTSLKWYWVWVGNAFLRAYTPIDAPRGIL